MCLWKYKLILYGTFLLIWVYLDANQRWHTWDQWCEFSAGGFIQLPLTASMPTRSPLCCCYFRISGFPLVYVGLLASVVRSQCLSASLAVLSLCAILWLGGRAHGAHPLIKLMMPVCTGDVSPLHFRKDGVYFSVWFLRLLLPAGASSVWVKSCCCWVCHPGLTSLVSLVCSLLIKWDREDILCYSALCRIQGHTMDEQNESKLSPSSCICQDTVGACWQVLLTKQKTVMVLKSSVFRLIVLYMLKTQSFLFNFYYKTK